MFPPFHSSLPSLSQPSHHHQEKITNRKIFSSFGVAIKGGNSRDTTNGNRTKRCNNSQVASFHFQRISNIAYYLCIFLEAICLGEEMLRQYVNHLKFPDFAEATQERGK